MDRFTKKKIAYQLTVQLLSAIAMIAVISFMFIKWDMLTKDILSMKIMMGFVMFITIVLCLVAIIRLYNYIKHEVFG